MKDRIFCCGLIVWCVSKVYRFNCMTVPEVNSFNSLAARLLAFFVVLTNGMLGQTSEDQFTYEGKHVMLGVFAANGYYDLHEIDLGRYKNHGTAGEYGFFIQSTKRLWVGAEVHFSKDFYNLNQLERLDTSKSLIYTKEVLTISISPMVGFDLIRKESSIVSAHVAYRMAALLRGKDLEYGIYEEGSTFVCYPCQGGALLNSKASSLSLGLDYKYWLNDFVGIGLTFEVNAVLQSFEKDSETAKSFQPILRFSIFTII